ncbi:MAG: phosphate ABC transporter permease subunit PstC [Candidatus Methylacidiphilales bacterium]|nr:phosphate ABC transporter permease subunit PstC [Candidatus Methylacidiphilales bacterium]
MNPTLTASAGVIAPLSPADLEKELQSALYEQRTSMVEFLIERGMFCVSMTVVATILLIFLFVTKEAVPVIFGRTDTARSGIVMNPAELGRMSSKQVGEFLGQSPSVVENLPANTLAELVLERNKELAKESNPDAKLNTTTWSMMTLPFQWSGDSAPTYKWQPVGNIEKYNFIPLLWGSFKVTLIALLVATPISLMSAIYVSQLATERMRELIKPSIELLAGVPSVVLGFLALMVLAPGLKEILGTHSMLNSFVAGLVLALAVIPIIFTIAEDSLSAVPQTHRDAALAMGAGRWDAAIRVVLPAAAPGVCAAVVLGFGRAIGETMVVVMASGNAADLSWSIFDSVRTVTAAIAAELPESATGSAHYQVLFLIGSVLFLITFFTNVTAEYILQRLRESLEGATAAEDHGLMNEGAAASPAGASGGGYVNTVV